MIVMITSEYSSTLHLIERLEFVFALMEREHKNADTHAQRNNYQAVIRYELEAIRTELQHARPPDKNGNMAVPAPGDIPF